MCGRFTITTAPERWVDLLQVSDWPAEFTSRFNIAPTQNIVCVTEAEGRRAAQMMKWGLIPSWAKDVKMGARMINARSETAAEKPSFRTALKKRRCLIPADGFFEWEKIDSKTKQPWLIHYRQHTPFAFAALWESWVPPTPGIATAAPIFSCSILTTQSNSEMAEIHDRMPVVIQPQQYSAWLSSAASPGQVQQLMNPVADGSWNRFQVNRLVGNVKNDVPECIQPLEQSDRLF
ncbi:MAG: SOS response-associated peptidase [Fuerstiella sp.]